MDSYTKFFAIIFTAIWIVVMASGIGRSIYYKRYTKPYLDLHATEAAILFYKTCISSGIDLSQLEQNALNANMTPVKDLAVSPNVYGLKKIFGKWEKEAMQNTKKKWKYKPFPYEVSLREVEYKGRNIHVVPKSLCQINMHTGVMKVSNRPYYIPRRSYHSDYKLYLRNTILWMLKQEGAELKNAPSWDGASYAVPKPVAYTLDGKAYHLKVDFFSITLELAEEVQCITCDLYPQPEVVQKRITVR